MLITTANMAILIWNDEHDITQEYLAYNLLMTADQRLL